jgi:hypothetical protein
MSRIGIKRYNLHRLNAGTVKRRPGFLQIQEWTQQAGSLLTDLILFDLSQSDIVGSLRGSIPPSSVRDTSLYHFCVTHIYIPREFNLAIKPFNVGTPPASINEIKEIGATSVSGLGDGYYDIVHTISTQSVIEHPCTKKISTLSPLISTLSVNEKPFLVNGSKACAYAVYTATGSNLSSVHLIFYVENIDQKLADELDVMYPLAKKEISDLYDKPTTWTNVFVIPMLLPNSSIIYQIIPDTESGPKQKGGQEYLKDNWLSTHTENLWLGIDVNLVFYDKWETFVTLDAKIKPPC